MSHGFQSAPWTAIYELWRHLAESVAGREDRDVVAAAYPEVGFEEGLCLKEHTLIVLNAVVLFLDGFPARGVRQRAPVPVYGP